MKQRSVIAVLLLPFVTFGIYSLYWAVKTKGEMNRLGESIPTAWLLIIPIIGPIWWYFKYSKGVEHVSHGKMGTAISFLLLYLLGFIGQAIIQDTFNNLGQVPAASTYSGTPNQAPQTGYAAPVSPQPIAGATAPVTAPTNQPPYNPQPPTNPPQAPTPPSPPLVSG